MAKHQVLIANSFICHKCIGNPELKRRIIRMGETQTCGSCGRQKKGLRLSKLAEIVGAAFENFYEPGDEVPEFDEDQDSIGWGQEGRSPEDIIAELIDAKQEIVDAIDLYLSSGGSYAGAKERPAAYYDSSTYYVEANLNSHRHFHVWRKFQERIKHARRFFDLISATFLGDIFKGIDEFSFAGAPTPVRIIDPKKSVVTVYRARRAAKEETAKEFLQNPSIELGPPPAEVARAGRMNPAGISIFYGAFDIDTCVAELRPSVGSFVVYCSFKILKKVKLLDLSVFERKIKIPVFNETEYSGLRRWKFLRSFHRQIIKPVQPEDELIEYIPTQAVAEYISNILKYDGIIYSSAQTGKRQENVALFNPSVVTLDSNLGKRDSSEPGREHEEDEGDFVQLLQYVPDSAQVAWISGARYTRKIMDEEDMEWW